MSLREHHHSGVDHCAASPEPGFTLGQDVVADHQPALRPPAAGSRACPAIHARTAVAGPLGRVGSLPVIDPTAGGPSADDLPGTGPTGRRRAGSDMIARWNNDWDWWASQPVARMALARWGERHECLAGLRSMEEALGALGNDLGVPQALADRRLAVVVQEARSGDRDAARLALQRVFPGLVQRAAARARSHRVPLEALLEELLSAAWLGIIQFPLERRPVKIAVNIIKDAENTLFGYVPQRLRRCVPMAPDDLPHPCSYVMNPADDPEDREGAIPRVLLEAIGPRFTREDARLLAQLVVFELPLAEVAREARNSERWVRTRKQRALNRLAAELGHRGPHAVEQVSGGAPDPVPGGDADE